VKRETDEELLARIKWLEEERNRTLDAYRAVERKLRGAHKSWGFRQERKWQASFAQQHGFKTYQEYLKASDKDCSLRRKLRMMTVANGCTESEAAVAAEKLSRIKGR
jgi:hypothetical protein